MTVRSDHKYYLQKLNVAWLTGKNLLGANELLSTPTDRIDQFPPEHSIFDKKCLHAIMMIPLNHLVFYCKIKHVCIYNVQ